MRYYQKITGERLYLSPVNREDAETYTRWFNDFAMTDGLGCSAQVLTLEEEKKFLEAEDNAAVRFAIVRTEDDRFIGGCDLHLLDHRNQTAEAGIFIGDAEARGHGYGTEALRLLAGFGFDYLNLHSIQLRVYSFNEQAVACYRKVGFREAGRLREAIFVRGKFHDILYMDLLRAEYQAR